MKIRYDSTADAAYVQIADAIERGGVASTYMCEPREVQGMINLDFDSEGRLLGIEVLDASKLLPPEALLAPEQRSARDATTSHPRCVATLAVGDVTWEVTSTPGSSAQHVDVAVTRDGLLVWQGQQPSWRGVSFGASGATTYMWTARTLVVFASASTGQPETLEVDEDLIWAFMRGDDWLLVCESSVRLWSSGVERSRLESGEVIDRVTLGSDELLVTEVSGKTFRVRLDGGTLEANDRGDGSWQADGQLDITDRP